MNQVKLSSCEALPVVNVNATMLVATTKRENDEKEQELTKREGWKDGDRCWVAEVLGLKEAREAGHP